MENKEVVHSWFVLAEILAVIAGIFIITGGLGITPESNRVDLFYDTVRICNDIAKGDIVLENISLADCLNKTSEQILQSINDSNNAGFSFLYLGFLFGFNSLLFWIIGRLKLEDESLEDKKFAVRLTIVDLVLLVIIFLNFY